MTRERFHIVVDGVEIEVAAGWSVAAALTNARLPIRESVGGESRGALCGMGICHECRVTIDGQAYQRACMTLVAPGMIISRNG